MSAALSTSMRRTPGGVGSDTGPQTSTTSAPASRAACATAKPILPELRLLTKRTGSIGSRVGPAVISTRRPLSTPLGTSVASTRSREFEGLEHPSRHRPRHRPGRRSAGPKTCDAARLSRVATLAWVAALAHI